MNALFCCDWFLCKDADGNYYDITLTDSVLERYTKKVDMLYIVARVRNVEDRSYLLNYTKIENENVKVIELYDFFTLRGMFTGRKILRRKLEDLVLSSQYIYIRLPSFIGNIISEIAIQHNKMYLSEVGGCAWDSYWNHSIKGKLFAPYMFIKMRQVLKKSIFTSYVTREFLQRRYPSRGETCSCSNVVLKQISDSVLELRLNRIMETKEKNLIILGTTAAVNVKYKGHEYVIKAISKLIKKGYNIRYEMIGGGSTEYLRKVALKYNVINNVKFLGVKKSDQVLAWLDNIDIYIQPSKQEGLPRALIEAMSRGCPSIGSSTAGIPELLDREYIFKSGNFQDLSNKIENLNNKNNMREQAKRNFDRSKDYLFEVINIRRTEFFEKYSIESLKQNIE